MQAFRNTSIQECKPSGMQAFVNRPATGRCATWAKSPGGTAGATLRPACDGSSPQGTILRSPELEFRAMAAAGLPLGDQQVVEQHLGPQIGRASCRERG